MEEGKRVGLWIISPEDLASALGFPGGVVLGYGQYEHTTDLFFHIAHPSMPVLEPSMQMVACPVVFEDLRIPERHRSPDV